MKILVDKELLERLAVKCTPDGGTELNTAISFQAGKELRTILDAAQPAQQQGVPEGLNKTREQWAKVDVDYCAKNNSVAANFHLIRDAQRDIERLHRALAAAPAPVHESPWIPVSERLPDVPEGDEQEVIVCVQRAHNGKRYVFSARYLNKFPLFCGDEEPLLATGWHDVKEHADYDGWYEPLSLSDGDEIVGWQPLPPAPEVKP
jgi:hypothetical protein